MCGIAGIIAADRLHPDEEARVIAMRDVLIHRGPDGAGLHIDGQAALAHRRLSIVDLHGGHQPLANEDESIWVVFNGEIYNFEELQQELIAKGHVFKTKSDTEAIVHLYEEEGENCFRRLRGMFSIAIWDSRHRKLVLARDRVGKKPLFYLYDGSRLVFASVMK